MNRPRQLAWLGLAALLSSTMLRAAAPASPSPATPAQPPPLTLQQRIDTLLKHRLRPEPLPVDLPNPFLTTTGAIRETAADGPKTGIKREGDPVVEDPVVRELAAATNAEVLVACASRLRIGGMITIKDQIHVVINGIPRKEGDTIAADWNNSLVHMKIVRLLPGQVVVRSGELEAAIKY